MMYVGSRFDARRVFYDCLILEELIGVPAARDIREIRHRTLIDRAVYVASSN